MRQHAPDPVPLRELVAGLRYRDGFTFRLTGNDYDRGQGSEGLTLIINITGRNSYPPHNPVSVNHLFPVPPAAYDRRSWQRWLFDQIGLVELHERCEWFTLAGQPDEAGLLKPYAPCHGPGNDPYLVREVGTEEDVRTSFRGVLDDGTGKPRPA
jgi:hypothetical protein